MANLLYITCNVKPQEQSRTLTLGYEFLEEYLQHNPLDEVQVLDLYRDNIQRIDQDLLTAWKRIEHGEDYVPESEEERRKMSRVWRLVDLLCRCDKYVFVTHSLNLWFPAEFKMFVDAICVPNRTYRTTSHGTEGMLTTRHRKSLHLHAGPANAYGVEQDQSVIYLRSLLNFLGVREQETVLIAGDDMDNADTKEYETVRLRLLNLARHY